MDVATEIHARMLRYPEYRGVLAHLGARPVDVFVGMVAKAKAAVRGLAGLRAPR